MKTYTLETLMENAGVIRNTQMCKRTMDVDAVQKEYVPASVARGLVEALKAMRSAAFNDNRGLTLALELADKALAALEE
jgi:hypothetical protein